MIRARAHRAARGVFRRAVDSPAVVAATVPAERPPAVIGHENTIPNCRDAEGHRCRDLWPGHAGPVYPPERAVLQRPGFPGETLAGWGLVIDGVALSVALDGSEIVVEGVDPEAEQAAAGLAGQPQRLSAALRGLGLALAAGELTDADSFRSAVSALSATRERFIFGQTSQEVAILWSLVPDPVEATRAAVALNPSTPRRALDLLARDESRIVGRHAFANESLTHDDRIAFATDPDPGVRRRFLGYMWDNDRTKHAELAARSLGKHRGDRPWPMWPAATTR